MRFIGLPQRQEHVSMKLSAKIHESLRRKGIHLLSKYVWDTKEKKVIPGDSIDNAARDEKRYLPALSDPELAGLLPKFYATMRVQHKDHGDNLFLCDHVNNIRYGGRSKEEFHWEEVEIRGNRLLMLIEDNPDFVFKVEDDK